MEKRNRELDLAGLFDKDSDYEGMLGEAIQELLDVFHKQGHSGFSAQRTAYLFYTLIKNDILSPLTGEDSEWNSSLDNDGTIKQNNRLSAVFKNVPSGKAYYLHAIVWKGQNPRDTFTGRVDDIQSRQFVKFPFYPKTFYIDVLRDEKGEYTIKDREQLLEVFEYYDEYKPTK